MQRRRSKRKRKKSPKRMTEFERQKHKTILARKRSKTKIPSVQTLKRKKGQHIWSLWVRKVQVVYLYKIGWFEHGRCEKCGRMQGLQADHVIPKSNFRIILHDPLNGQVLCNWCNDDKGSVHTDGTDYRPLNMRKFYAKAAALHWEQYGQKGIWQLNDVGKAWVRSNAQRFVIPGLTGPAGRHD